jgi:hypothetical protein
MPGQLCSCLSLLAWYGSTSQGLSAPGVHQMVAVSLYITRCTVQRIKGCKVWCRSMLKALKGLMKVSIISHVCRNTFTHTELMLNAPSRVLMIYLAQQSELFIYLLSLRWLPLLCMLTSLSILISKPIK